MPGFSDNLTIPNLLSLFRIAAIPFVVIAMTEHRFDLALAIFTVCAGTDLLDGYLARRFGWTSKLGAFLDPAGDKLLLVAVYVALTVPQLPARFHFPVWLTLLVLSRDVLIVAVSLVIFVAIGHREFPPSILGKITTAVLLIDAALALLANFVPLGAVGESMVVGSAAAVTLASGIDYVIRTSRLAATKQ